MNAAKQQYADDVAALKSNIDTTKDTLDNDGTADLVAARQALEDAINARDLHSDAIVTRTRLANELMAKQVEYDLAPTTALETEISDLNDKIQEWSIEADTQDLIQDYIDDVDTKQDELDNAIEFEYESRIDWNEARLEHLSRTSEADLATLKTELISALEATLPPLEAACTLETETEARLQGRYDVVEGKIFDLESDYDSAE